MKLNKEDWLRLLEKAIDNIPETVTAIASLVTAITVARQNKKRKPKSRQRKKVNAKRLGRKPLTPLFYQMERGNAMVSAIAIFIIAINVYIYLKNKKDK